MTLREQIAKSIYEGRNGAKCTPWNRICYAHKEAYLRDADAALRAIEKAKQ